MKKWLIIVLSLIALIGVVYFCLPKYAQRAIIYLKPGINDIKIFPTNTVKANAPEAVNYHDLYNKRVIDGNDRHKMESYDPVAFVIFKEGKLFYEEYWDKYNDSSYSNIFSASKSIIGLLVGIAIDKGYINSVDECITKYVPEFGEEYNYITIANLLTMSSGLKWEEAYSSLFGNTTEAYYGKDLKKVILRQEPIKTPGKEFYYSSGTTALLGLILKNATSMSVSDFASQYLWTQIGAEYDALWSLDHKGGIEKSYCCFYSNARDLARLGQLVLQDGKWGEKQVVSQEYLQKALTNTQSLIDNKNYWVDYYGYQWWLLKYKYFNIKYARGLYGQYIIAIPELDMVVVRLGRERDNTQIGAHPKDVFLYIDIAEKMAN